MAVKIEHTLHSVCVDSLPGSLKVLRKGTKMKYINPLVWSCVAVLTLVHAIIHFSS